MSLSPDAVQKHRLLQAPRVLFFVAVAVLVWGAAGLWQTPSAGREPGLLMIGLYLGWLMFEVPVTFQGATAMKDTRTLIPYALARIATIGACVLIASPAPWLPWGLLGTGLFVAGVVLREVAIKTLGRFYTHHVAQRTDQVAVTTGPYRFIRHPAYFGMLLAHAGLVVAFPHPLSAFCGLLLLTAVIWRIRVEERALWNMPGYAEYATRKARLWPGLW